MSELLPVAVVSDATGATAEAVGTSVLVQYGSAAVDVTNRSIEETSD